MSLNSTIHGITAVSAMRSPSGVPCIDLAWVFVVYISKAFKWRRPENWQCEISGQNQICYLSQKLKPSPQSIIYPLVK